MYFFIGGSQRSGTSLLLRILCDDPATHPFFGECSYARKLAEAYVHGKNVYKDELQYLYDSPEAFRDAHADLMRGFFDQARTRFDTQHLALKEPHLTTLFPDLWELFGDEARFLILIRDPRDVIASMLNVGEKMAADGVSSVYNSGDLARLIKVFNSFYIKPLEAYRDIPELRAQTLLVRYEQLVSQPEQVLNQVRGFTGLSLPLEEAPGKRNLKDGPSKRTSHWNTELSGQAISTAKVSNYRQRLTPEQIAQVEAGCKDFMRIFGYQTS